MAGDRAYAPLSAKLTVAACRVFALSAAANSTDVTDDTGTVTPAGMKKTYNPRGTQIVSTRFYNWDWRAEQNGPLMLDKDRCRSEIGPTSGVSVFSSSRTILLSLSTGISN